MDSSLQDDIVNSEIRYEKNSNMLIYYRIVNDVSKQVSAFEADSNRHNMCTSECY